jgi:hypothetical protein
MGEFELPHDFAPTTKKNYGYQGVHFEVWVQDKGLQPQTPSRAPHLLWIFAVWVQGRIVECGKYHWDPSDRTTNDEEVCNYIFTYHQNSPKVRAAIQQPYKITPSLMFGTFVQKCATFMFQQLITTVDISIYYVVASKVSPEEWHVILYCPHIPERMFEFRKKTDSSRTAVSIHVKAHSFFEEIN